MIGTLYTCRCTYTYTAICLHLCQTWIWSVWSYKYTKTWSHTSTNVVQRPALASRPALLQPLLKLHLCGSYGKRPPSVQGGHKGRPTRVTWPREPPPAPGRVAAGRASSGRSGGRAGGTHQDVAWPLSPGALRGQERGWG